MVKSSLLIVAQLNTLSSLPMRYSVVPGLMPTEYPVSQYVCILSLNDLSGVYMNITFSPNIAMGCAPLWPVVNSKLVFPYVCTQYRVRTSAAQTVNQDISADPFDMFLPNRYCR